MVSLTTLDSLVIAPAGIVYSTAPQIAVGPDGKNYYVKGWDADVAFSEVAGCLLAKRAGLRVPNAVVCSFSGKLCAGVEEVEHPIRNIAPWLATANRIVNRADLYAMIAEDTWLANDDRNMGNIVGSPATGAQILLSMIDFEKSKSLGRTPAILSAQMNPKRLWPTGELGTILKRSKPAIPPDEVIRRIEAINRHDIKEIIRSVSNELGFVNWSESSIDVLVGRAERIRALLEEVWREN